MYRGDCLDIIPTLPKGSINAVICDPPYGINFVHSGGGAWSDPKNPL